MTSKPVVASESVRVTHSAWETRELGREIGLSLRPGDVVLLRGDLGAGKTTLTKGIAVALGVAAEIQSPTFTLVAEYLAPYLGPDGWLLHVDLYRLAGDADLATVGLAEQLDRDDAVVVIEWPERASDLFSCATHLVRIEQDGDDRSIFVARVEQGALGGR